MTESARSSYQPLFEVRLLHHYWLDDGATVFDLIPDADRKIRLLLGYDRRTFLAVAPTLATRMTLKGLNGIYKDTALGFIVAVAENQKIPSGTLLEFAVSVVNADFFNYTALTLPPRKITELYHPSDDKIYRYKLNVFVFSNLTGSTRNLDNTKTLFLSSAYAALSGDDKIEALVAAGGGLSQLTNDPPNPTVQQLNASANTLPAFVHQNDVPVVEPPPGLAGAPERGLLLSADIPDTIFALIRLSPVRADDNAFSFTDGGLPKTPHPVFQLRFKSRSTIRRYRNPRSGTVDFTESDPLPLTRFGNAGTRQSPPVGNLKTETSGTRITRLISDIFI
jgi:hypothetical protein